MALNIKVLNSCKFLAVTANRYDTAVNQADIQVTNIDPNVGGTYTANMAYDATTGKGRINIPITNLTTSNGVFEVCQVEGGIKKACKPVVIHCDIDCCLTKLTNEIVDCSCDCPRCASALAKAQKVFLLLQSALSSAELATTQLGSRNSGYYTDILEKYLKAKSICDNSCGCNC